jgi:DNA-binding NarL/FixJ family response regulator
MLLPHVYAVLLVEDHPTTRLGLRYTFEREPDFTVVGEAGDIGAAFDLLPQSEPDLVVTDLKFEGRGGLELIRQIRAHHPHIRVLVHSMHDVQLYADRALHAGAGGYVTKGQPPEEVLRAARAVLRGEPYLEPDFPGELPATPDRPGFDAAIASLTDRELEVFLLLGQGYAPRHVAEELCLSVSTVEVYRERLKAKLGLADSALLVRFAVRWLRDHERGALT